MDMKIASLIVTILFLSATIAGQENKISSSERVVLDNPEVITLKLAPIVQLVSAGVRKPLSGPFNTESTIKLKLSLPIHRCSRYPYECGITILKTVPDS
jgi:hypothetical protein